jgi:hypothetical protein
LHSVGVMVSVARGEERSDESEVDLLGWFCVQGRKEDHEEVAHGCPGIQQTKGIMRSGERVFWVVSATVE